MIRYHRLSCIYRSSKSIKKNDGNFGNDKSFYSFAADFEVMEIQERIAQKAHDLFLRYGIRSISMDEIASQLGISKKTIYQFYADKDTLVDSAIDIVVKHNANECSMYREQSENPVHEIFVAADMVKEMLKTMNPTIMYDLQKYHPAAYKKIADHKNKFLYRQIKENLEQGIAMQLYRPDLNTDLVARFRLASVFMLFNPDLFHPGKLDFGTILEELTVLFLYGITSLKGQKLVQKYYQKRQGNHT
ncbi:TetR/AcrR family transcriptional regulator [Agriterribacter sp.]|uniref:TetR/AcrR family transcriptional regulator n=1 Tax=Agriterribacter sp. TaxID=2821509 RepID=UPI002BADB74E|nr:TetR/AcrR family transcriptional regulator [Agriterribacter sp.]HTN05604.1 TetR/AcrR family transcriptional regulator [Agriterribacter sp.]